MHQLFELYLPVVKNETAGFKFLVFFFCSFFFSFSCSVFIIMLRKLVKSTDQTDNGDCSNAGVGKRRSSAKMDRKLQALKYTSKEMMSAARTGDVACIKKILKENKKDCDILVNMTDQVCYFSCLTVY